MGGYAILPTRMRHRRPRPGKARWWQHGLLWERRALHIRCVWDRGKRHSRLWLARRVWDRGGLGPLPHWLVLLLLACGGVEPNPGPTSNLWQLALVALRRGVTKPHTACLGTHDGHIRWATYNIEGPTVDWDRWMMIVQLLNDMQLDVAALQEVKRTFCNITSATTLTFPELQMYYNPHPDGNVNGVPILVRNTLDPFVKRRPNKTSALFQDPQGTMLGIIVHLPNRKPLQILNYYGLHSPNGKHWQDMYVGSYDYDVQPGADTIWSHHPTWCWHGKLHTRGLYDPHHELNPEASAHDAHTRGRHRLDAILLSPAA